MSSRERSDGERQDKSRKCLAVDGHVWNMQAGGKRLPCACDTPDDRDENRRSSRREVEPFPGQSSCLSVCTRIQPHALLFQYHSVEAQSEKVSYLRMQGAFSSYL